MSAAQSFLGTGSASIEREQRTESCSRRCQEIGEPTIPSEITYDMEQAEQAAEKDRISGSPETGLYPRRNGRRICREQRRTERNSRKRF